MAKKDIKRASLSDLKKMKAAGELFHDPNAPIGDDLSADFWDNATVIEPQGKKSIHLRVDADILEFFKEQGKGKGHLTPMNAVLRSYVDAHRPR